MPWKIEDVPKFKKGLSKKQSAQWVRIANSVLAACIKKGGNDKTCAPKAIKQANSVVINTNMEQYASYLMNSQELEYEITFATHQDKAHLVVPVTMMVEGVHNGSQGAVLHEIGELGKFPESWNGIPVVIYHPEKDGVPISANYPDIIDKEIVGRVYNTNVDGDKLKAEVWLDEDRLNSISAETLEAVNNMKAVEISLGMFTENEMEEGKFGDEDYVAIAHNHRPDHLAILPDQIGACSIADGCGLGANKKKDMIQIDFKLKGADLLSVFQRVTKEGYKLSEIGNHAEEGYNERMQMVYDKLRSLEIPNSSIYYYLEEMYDDYLIYTKSGDNDRTMYKQTYKIESGKVEFVGEPIEVHKKVEYVVNSRFTRTKFSTNNKNEKKMAKENDCPKCLEKINALIANKESKFDEADRELLLTLEETVLDKLAPVVKEIEKVVEKTVEVNKLTPEDQAALNYGKKQLAENRSKMIKGIQANTAKGILTDEKLKVMDDDTLEAIYKSVKKDEEVNYELNGGVVNHTSNGEEPLYPAGVEVETEKK